MSNDEIFAIIGRDIVDLENSLLGIGRRDITIWMTKDLFNRLLPEEFLLQKDYAMTTLFGCKVKVVLFSYDGMQWIVGYEGKIEEGE